MDKPVKHKPMRVYCFQRSPALGGRWPEVIRIRADVMCESDGQIELKREGQVVGRISFRVSAWWIEEASGDE